MNYYNAGYATAQFMISLAVLAGLVVGIVAIVRAIRKPPQPATANGSLVAAFALVPGERCGVIWQAAHTSGHPMMATITSTGVFALNHYTPQSPQPQSPPLRMMPDGVAVTAGSPSTVTPGAAEPMVQVSLSRAGQLPVAFWIAQSGAQALVAWARPSL